MSGNCVQLDEPRQVSHRITSMNLSGRERKTIWWHWMPAVFAWLAACFLAAHSAAYGQSTTYARLVGTIKDQSGAVIPSSLSDLGLPSSVGRGGFFRF